MWRFLIIRWEKISLGNCHEATAKAYCCGTDYEYLSRVKYNSKDLFDEWKQDKNFKGGQSDIDEFSTTNLTPNQFILLKNWVDIKKSQNYYIDYTQFLNRVCNFDKVNCTKRIIETTFYYNYRRLYNYRLMNWSVFYISAFVYDKENSRFKIYDNLINGA